MPKIPKEIINQITETASENIVNIVGDYVQLKRRGASYMGCCPFHGEKTPSFSVNPTRGFYYCFGCHKGGNAVNFLMEIEKQSYPEAIRNLGNRFGISIPEVELSPEEDRAARERDAVYNVMEYAARTYESNLRDTEEGQAYGITYFRSRGFRDDTIAKFRLGYSLNSSLGLSGKALAEGFKEDALIRAGLLKENPERGDKYDYFRGRVMFPIQNTSGKVIAFGGRVLDARTKGVNVKYLNSPETELYKKTDIVYGIYQARTAISRKDKCFLVEGYTDVISMHQSGIENVVASSGTALTTNQIRLIKRFTNKITVLYDGDSAGIHASLRGIDMILQEGMDVRVLLLPDGDDPDSFSRKHTADEFQAYVEAHETDFIRYESETLLANCGGDPLKKADATRTIVTSISHVQDPINRELYIKECSRIMGVKEETLFTSLEKQMTENAIKEREEAVRADRQRKYEEERALAAQQGQQGQPQQYQQYQQQYTQQYPQQGQPQQGQWQGQQQGQPQPPASQGAPPDDFPTDLSPSEMAMLGMGGGYAGGGSSRAAQPAAKPQPTVVPDEVELREIMRFFVTYTQSVIHTASGDFTVGDYILTNLDADQIRPQTPALAKILDEYRNAEDRTKIDSKYFTISSDPDVSAFTAACIGGRPTRSKMFKDNRPEDLEENSLDEFVPRSMNELQMKMLNKMYDDTLAEITSLDGQENPDEERINELMQLLSQINLAKKELALEMGDRAIVR